MKIHVMCQFFKRVNRCQAIKPMNITPYQALD